jgi:predicted RNA-binding Zn-ribbon protein involved in translation (DUF1610 family)
MADASCCGHYYEVSDELIGHSFTCPKCGRQMVFRKTFSGSYAAPVPAAPSVSPPPPPPTVIRWNRLCKDLSIISAVLVVVMGVVLSVRLLSASDRKAAVAVASEEMRLSPYVSGDAVVTDVQRDWSWARKYRVEFITSYQNENGDTQRGIVICRVNLDTGEMRLTHRP